MFFFFFFNKSCHTIKVTGCSEVAPKLSLECPSKVVCNSQALNVKYEDGFVVA